MFVGQVLDLLLHELVHGCEHVGDVTLVRQRDLSAFTNYMLYMLNECKIIRLKTYIIYCTSSALSKVS